MTLTQRKLLIFTKPNQEIAEFRFPYSVLWSIFWWAPGESSWTMLWRNVILGNCLLFQKRLWHPVEIIRWQSKLLWSISLGQFLTQTRKLNFGKKMKTLASSLVGNKKELERLKIPMAFANSYQFSFLQNSFRRKLTKSIGFQGAPIKSWFLRKDFVIRSLALQILLPRLFWIRCRVGMLNHDVECESGNRFSILTPCWVCKQVSREHVQGRKNLNSHLTELVPETSWSPWRLQVLWYVHLGFVVVGWWLCCQFLVPWNFSHNTWPIFWSNGPYSGNFYACAQIFFGDFVVLSKISLQGAVYFISELH